jgi:hypothetical protein
MGISADHLCCWSFGGVVNALLSDNGFALPKPEKVGTTQIIRPGFIGNVLISGVAACISWGLYGPFSALYIAGGPEAADATALGENIDEFQG